MEGDEELRRTALRAVDRERLLPGEERDLRLDHDLVLLVAEESRLARRNRLWSARTRGRAGDDGDNQRIT